MPTPMSLPLMRKAGVPIGSMRNTASLMLASFSSRDAGMLKYMRTCSSTDMAQEPDEILIVMSIKNATVFNRLESVRVGYKTWMRPSARRETKLVRILSRRAIEKTPSPFVLSFTQVTIVVNQFLQSIEPIVIHIFNLALTCHPIFAR